MLKDRRDNNYDVLRLIAATLVIVSHAAALSGSIEPAVPFTHDTLGFDGVLIFFAISGLLITQSWKLDPRFWAFAWKRALRILPGLFVACVFTAYAVVPFFTSWQTKDYLLNLRPVRYVIMNTFMITNHDLPGSFPDNHLITPNGSLGTLPVEVKAYIILAFVGLALVVKSRLQKTVFAAVAVAVIAVSPFVGLATPGKVGHLFAVFAGASLLCVFERRVPMRWWLFVAGVGLWVLSYHVGYVGMLVLQAVSVPYIVKFLGSHGLSRLRFLTKPGDVSYGLYIYAFPVQQAVVAAIAPDRNAWIVVLVSFPITYLLAFASWRLVERPALRLKRVFASPTAAPDPVTETQPEPAGPVEPALERPGAAQ